MKRILPVLVLIASPLLGGAVGTVIAWQVYPGHEFVDVSARTGYLLWGAVAGAVVGVIGAIALGLFGKGSGAPTATKKRQLKCNACGALHPLTPVPTECDWCRAEWSGTEVVA